MKRKTVFTRIASFVLTIALLTVMGVGGISAWAAETDNAERASGVEKAVVYPASEAGIPAGQAVCTKSEDVYAKLSQDGTVKDIYIVNAFTVSESGAVKDYGVYDEVRNLTDLGEINMEVDTVTFKTDKENFYYDGVPADAQLPWNIKISYTLNGRNVKPDTLAGSNGNIGIHITTGQNKAVNPVFYDNYLLQISIALDADKCKSIKADGASVANAGSSKIVTFTVMPGKDADITVTAAVRDFEMSGIDIAAMPFSTAIEIPDTDDMLDGMTTLADAIAALNDGVGNLKTGVNDLNVGVGGLVDGSSDYAKGLSALDKNSGLLAAGSSEIKSALATIAASLNNADGDGGTDMSGLAQLPAGLRGMADGLDQVTDGLTQLRDGYVYMFTTLDGAIMNIHAANDDDFAKLGAAVGNLTDLTEKNAANEALDRVLTSYAAAQTAKGTYESIRGGMSAVGGSLTAIVDGDQDHPEANPGLRGMIAALRALADTIESALGESDMMAQIRELALGLATLSAQYDTFHAGLAGYTEGVAQLASGYDALHGGLVKLNEGTGNLAEGVRDLHEGTGKLEDETSDLPDTIQVEIDKLMEDYDVGEYVPVSYISNQNTNVAAVQFVIVTEPIKMPAAPDNAENESAPQSFWGRLAALFEK
ncbi:MAG: hypothetical protein LBO81_07050 [Clostridiales Family XIII bacterium]|jgi:X-X-X-Leu-X-X-Gly heptad repeat protein|nr:hypothetical protein [Clostridiales Family XIII bacterium]